MVTVELHVLNRGETRYLEAAWELKERIRRNEGVFTQPKDWFTKIYRRMPVFVLIESDSARGEASARSAADSHRGQALVGFAVVRRDGYLFLLAVHPPYQKEGHGRALVTAVAADYAPVTCHTRATNEGAIAFYQHLGFELERRVPNYYALEEDAYVLRLPEDTLESERSP